MSFEKVREKGERERERERASSCEKTKEKEKEELVTRANRRGQSAA